jgi:predicted branched-subunit amino acid permease
VYGKIYGASAKDVLGPTESILSSAIIFSGTVQFAILGLLTKGSTWAAVLVTAIGLSARNIALGGAIRPSLPEARARRFLLAWTVVDEAVGLALSAASSRVRVLVTAGLLFYIAWLGGTIFGSLIGSLSEFTEVSSAAYQSCSWRWPPRWRVRGARSRAASLL